MGYSTIQISKFQINGEVTPELVAYINNFSETRRIKRSNEEIKKLYPNWKDYCLNNELGTDGEYFACPKEIHNDASILDYNTPPTTQPSLWCDWKIVEEDGSYYIKWNRNEGFFYPAPWLKYMIDNFIVPNNLSVSGIGVSIGGQGDAFYMVVDNNDLLFCTLNEDDTTETVVSLIKSNFTNKDIINSCDEILSHAHDIDTLCSPDTDEDEWQELFEKYFEEV